MKAKRVAAAIATNSIELEAMADLLQAAGFALIKRINNTLDYPQIQDLSNRAQELFIKSKALTVLSVIDAGANAKPYLLSLERAKTDIEKAISSIEKVQLVIDIAASLLDVAAAILAIDPEKIIAHTKEVLDEVGKFE